MVAVVFPYSENFFSSWFIVCVVVIDLIKFQRFPWKKATLAHLALCFFKLPSLRIGVYIYP